jgi:hypothetical protein
MFFVVVYVLVYIAGVTVGASDDRIFSDLFGEYLMGRVAERLQHVVVAIETDFAVSRRLFRGDPPVGDNRYGKDEQQKDDACLCLEICWL